MQFMKPHVDLKSTGQDSGIPQNVLAALKVGAQQEGSDPVAPGFDNTLAALLTTLNGGEKPQKINEKLHNAAEKLPQEETDIADENAATEILASLLAAHQHPVASAPVKNGAEGQPQGVDAVSLQAGSAAAHTPQKTAPLTGQPGQSEQSNDGKTQAKEASSAGVKLVMTQPVATTVHQMAVVTPPVSSDATTVSASQETSSVSTANVNSAVRTSLPEIKLSDEHSRWSEQLQSSLGDRLQVQLKDKIQHATIRLDPPNMGKIDISMQIDNGRLQLHINANHGDVYRALQQVSHDLRQSLTEQNFVQVNVQVSSQHPGQQQGNRQGAQSYQNEAVMANVEMTEDENYSSHQDDESVLLMV
jgi:Flagellar hook-length control protein